MQITCETTSLAVYMVRQSSWNLLNLLGKLEDQIAKQIENLSDAFIHGISYIVILYS